MTPALQSLIADYTARGWDFNNLGELITDSYYVTSPALAALGPNEDFYFQPAKILRNPPAALRGATDREILEDALLAAEAETRAGALYGDKIWNQLGDLYNEELRQIAILLRKGVDPSAVIGTHRVSIEIKLS